MDVARQLHTYFPIKQMDAEPIGSVLFEQIMALRARQKERADSSAMKLEIKRRQGQGETYTSCPFLVLKSGHDFALPQ